MCLPTAKADVVLPSQPITLMDQDYTALGAIPENVVIGNNQETYTDSTLTFNRTMGAIEYRTIGAQAGSVFVGIEPFINGNLTIRLKVTSDSWYSNVYIQGSTFWLQTQSLADGRARVVSHYQISPTAYSYKYYDVPATALSGGVNTINVDISGTSRTVSVYHNSTLGVVTPMSHWSVQQLPYEPVTQSILRMENEKSSVATWVATMLYGIKETVSGSIVSAIPGNDYVPFGIDYPRNDANSRGTEYMISHDQKGVAWADLQWLEYQPQQIEYIRSLLTAGWELGIHYNASLNGRSLLAAQTLMQQQYDQLTAIFGQAPTSWCSYQNADNTSHAAYAYEHLGMIWRNGYSGVAYLANIGNIQETRWGEFWSKISAPQMVYPSFTHKTDQANAEAYSISYATFTEWIDNYEGKKIIGFNEYYHRIRNQLDTTIHCSEYVEDLRLRFDFECNAYPTRLVIDFPVTEGLVVLKNGVSLTRNIDYTVENGQIVLYSASNAEFLLTSVSGPGAPMDLRSTPGNAQVTLQWAPPLTDGGNAITNYNIYRRTVASEETKLASVGGVLSYTDLSVVNGVSYCYQISAVTSAGEGPRSEEASVVPLTVPSAPLSIGALAGDAMVMLTWAVPADDGGSAITGYNIYWGTDQGPQGLTASVDAVTSYTDRSVINGVSYRYTVTAVNAAGEGPRSDAAIATPSAPMTVPSAPRNLQATVGDGLVALAWDEPMHDGGTPIIGYAIYRGTSAGQVSVIASLGTVLEYTDTVLINGMTYRYEIRALNQIGEGSGSGEVLAVPMTVPAAPSGPSAVAGNAQVFLTWEAPSNSGGAPISSYKVYRGTVSGDGLLIASLGDVLTYVDPNVSNGITYYYRISAANAAGEGPRSDQVRAVPATVPSAPSGLTAIEGNGAVTLSWEAPPNGGMPIDRYVVHRNGVEVATTTSTTFVDAGLTNALSYSYYVRAQNAIGIGPASDEIIAVPYSDKIVVTSPPSDEVWYKGSIHTITWTAHVEGDVSVELVLGNAVITTIASSTPNDGSEDWTVPSTIVPGSGYQVKVTAVSDGDEQALSPGKVRIPDLSVIVTEPSSATVAVAGGSITVSWTAQGTVSNLKVQLLRAGTVVATLSSDTPNDGSHSFSLPITLTPGDDYVVRLTDVGNLEIGDDSDSFSLRSPAITVTNPNGGQTIVLGSSVIIRWTGDKTVLGKVSITLWRDGKQISTIVSSTANDGSHSWTPSLSLIIGTGYSIRITPVSYSQFADSSDASFSVRKPVLTITAPTAGSSFARYSTLTVNWQKEAASVGMIKIELYKNGALYKIMTSGTSNDGNYSWRVPSMAAGAYQIKISSTSDPTIYDWSEVFTIR